MKIHGLTVADAFASLKSGLAGLSDAEARRRLVEFGANEVEEVAHEALLLTFAREFAHFFAIILWIAAALAFFAEWREPRQGMAALGFAIVGVIVINGVFSRSSSSAFRCRLRSFKSSPSISAPTCSPRSASAQKSQPRTS